jgi:hypothetical protein
MLKYRPPTVFIIRVWQEAREIETNQVEWRAMVECVQSGLKFYFHEPDALAEFFRSNIGGIHSEGTHELVSKRQVSS